MDNFLLNNTLNKPEIEIFRRWYSDSQKYIERDQLICLPSFFLAGFPKSRTSTFHEMLSLHPYIEALSVKEPQWWTRLCGFRKNGTIKGELVLPSFFTVHPCFQINGI